jgi:hypothetical protein
LDHVTGRAIVLDHGEGAASYGHHDVIEFVAVMAGVVAVVELPSRDPHVIGVGNDS